VRGVSVNLNFTPEGQWSLYSRAAQITVGVDRKEKKKFFKEFLQDKPPLLERLRLIRKARPLSCRAPVLVPMCTHTRTRTPTCTCSGLR
jgi:hypothetical protein